MARWLLRANHYLNVVDKWEWEYKQVDRKTGREIRKRMTVPRFLDIKDPGDWTVKPDGVSIAQGGSFDEAEGYIIVCQPGKGQGNDVEFLGDPTPDMEPIDDEAKAISAGFAETWSYRPDVPEMSYSQSIIEKFDTEMASIRDRANLPQQLVIPGLEDLVKQMAALAVNQNAIMEKLAKPTTRIGT